MTLEELISDNTKAVRELNATLKAGGGKLATATTAAATGTKAATTATKATKAADKPKHTFEQVNAAVQQVKNEISKETARDVIEGVAGAGKKLADIANLPQHWDALFAAAEQALSDNGTDTEEPDEDDNI